jgi:hypothetical protein
MTRSHRDNASSTREAALPRRDWILLPLLSLLTVAAIAIAAERVAQRVVTESAPFIQSCLEPGASWSGSRAFPNSVCWDKKFESQRVEYRFNSCGHRTRLECEAKQQGVYRIVLAGSSFAMGHLIPEDRTFASLLPVSLAQQTGRKVELYNEGMVGVNPHVLTLRFDEVLAAKPDLILWTVTAWDIQNALPPDDSPNPDAKAGSLERAWFRIKFTFNAKPLPETAVFLWKRFWREGQSRFADSSIAALIQRFIFESKGQYIKSSLMQGDAAGYLESTPRAEWRRRLRQFDDDAQDIAARAEAAGVPLVVVLVPSRVQAAMISTGKWPGGYDPYALDQELRSIIESHGGVYLDILPDLRSLPDPERYYFTVDGHPDVEGHAIIAGLLAKQLTSGAVPALRATPQPSSPLRQGR